MLRPISVYQGQSLRMDREKKWTLLISLLLILIFYLTLHLTQVPTYQQKKVDMEVYDILIENYRPKSHFQLPAPVPPSQLAANNNANPAPTATSPEVDQTKQLLNEMDKLMEMQSVSARSSADPFQTTSTTSQNPQLQIWVSNPASDVQLPSDVASSNMKPADLIKRQFQTSTPTVRLNTLQNTSDGPTTRVTAWNSDVDSRMIESKTNKSKVIQIPRVERLPDDFKVQIPKIFKKISQWMQDHPMNLPDPAKKLMDYKPNNLTSLVQFQIDGRLYDIYLLCEPVTYEIRICLIEGNMATLLIDEGFTHSSHFLRTGKVHRSTNNEILAFGTEQLPASKNQTEEFYQIFLSWWRTTGMDKL